MKWQNEYNVGIPVIDAQHKRLFELFAGLNEAVRGGLRHSDLEKLFETLDHYSKRHFSMEEKYMMECGFPDLKKQQEAHSLFAEKFSELRQELSERGLTPEIVGVVRDELTSWLKDHVTGMDKEFGTYYAGRKE